ncbi:flagellar hook protein FlgE [Roseibium aggregatum]|uniref:Flagellar hook protein FlgE n=1 Tax=Roseibium aggregatum TaxID=187304 RepID=A0A939EDS0_9HYPH|nr:flagellar hook-basal body complex protein [Roseibium aggregatum]MBN9671416.1 flagellar hook-basal body complex protein [Roseibium aggregatum]
MGIYGAINSAVSGLTAQATALENISGNVANSQTTGYKRLDTTFSDLVAGGGANQFQQVSGTTFATSRATNTVQGDITSVDVDTYMAINGEGYFVVTKAADVVDGSTTFAEETYYTRGGDFERDQEGYLINAAGYYLQGFPLDPITGNPVGDNPTVVLVDNQPLPASATTTVEYQANLPRVPQTNDYDGSIASALLDSGVTASADIPVADELAFLDSSISGGSITIYNDNGTAMNVEVRYAKIANADVGPPVVLDTWGMYINTDGDATNSWWHVGDADFTSSGALNSLTAGSIGAVNGTGDGFDIASLVIDGSTATNVEVTFSGGDLTQYSDPDGTASSVSLDQDGYPAGELTSVTVDEAGRVIANYSNSQRRAVYEIPLATFEAEQYLQRVDGAAFASTTSSGAADLSGGGQILSKKLELSNADIADEFSKLIITQQAYSANSKVVTSADEMLDDALNMVR